MKKIRISLVLIGSATAVIAAAEFIFNCKDNNFFYAEIVGYLIGLAMVLAGIMKEKKRADIIWLSACSLFVILILTYMILKVALNRCFQF